MSKISLTAPMRSNLLSLNQTTKLQKATQQRLSTGLKVNSAIDNPSSYFTAASLNNRAKDLTGLLDSMSQGIQTIKATIETLSAATKFLEQATTIAAKTAEIPMDTFAVVTNQDELLKAIESNKKGTILIDGKIDLADNTTITLNDGQNLIGKNSDAELNFNIAKADNGEITQYINMGNNSKLSSLTINSISDTRGNYVICATDKSNIEINNIKINGTFSGTVGSSITDYLIYCQDSNSIKLTGTNNLNISGGYGVRGLRAFNTSIDVESGAKINMAVDSTNGLHRWAEISDKSVLNIKKDSKINLDFKGTTSVSYFLCQPNSIINIDSAKINLLNNSSGAFVFSSTMNAQGAGTINITGNAVVNIKNQNTLSLFERGGSINIGKQVVFNLESQTNTFNLTAANADSVNVQQGAKFNYLNTADNSLSGSWIANSNIIPGMGLKTFNGAPGFDNSGNLPQTVILPDTKNLAAQKPLEKDRDDKSAEEQYKSQAKQYNAALDQYNMLIRDGEYKGINLLQSQKLSINFNESRSSKLEVKGVDASSKAMGLNDANWQSSQDIGKTLEELSSAINEIRDYQSHFGNQYSIVSNREKFTKNLINVLTEGADKLVLADMNEESANMLALQTRQQLAINALSLASQTAQGVLQLF